MRTEVQGWSQPGPNSKQLTSGYVTLSKSLSVSVKQGFWAFLRLFCTHPTRSHTECWEQRVRTAQSSAWDHGTYLESPSASLQWPRGL